MVTERGRPEIIFKGGEPKAVILHLDDYEEILQKLGDAEGLTVLEDARKRHAPSESA